MDEWMLVVLLAFCSLLLVFSILCLPCASLCVPRASPCIEFTPAPSRECLERFQKKKNPVWPLFFDVFFWHFLAKSLWTPYTLFFIFFGFFFGGPSTNTVISLNPVRPILLTKKKASTYTQQRL